MTIPVTVLPLADNSILSFISTAEVITVAATPTNSVTLPNAPKPLVFELSNVSLFPTA